MNGYNSCSLAYLLISLCLISACGDSGTNGGSGTGGATDQDILETGLQGQVPLADQLSGVAAQGYRKGLRLVGQNSILDRGANFSMAWLDDCAYVTTTSPGQIFGPTSSPYIDPQYSPLNGMAVIDAADPTNPKLLDILQSPAMIAPHESLHANQARHIIVGTRGGGTAFDIYDAKDCRNPVLKATINIGVGITLPPLPDLPGGLGTIDQGLPFMGHALCITDDGMTAYATSSAQSNAVIDLTDIENPSLIQLYAPASHDCGLNPDGTRLYQANFGFVSLGLGLPNGPAVGQNGLLILDVSGFQDRSTPPSPLMFGTTPPQVGFLGWTNLLEGEAPSAGSHTARWFKNGGRTYLYSSDEWPTSGVCPWAHGRIIDITDETNPIEVADITLEVNQLENCLTTELDIANYSAHYVGFDDVNNATTLFTTHYSAGLRVWDIHDPANPVEIAYWHPAPNPNTPTVFLSEGFGSSADRWDAVATYVRYRPETGHIWIAGYSSGFQILEFTDSAGPTVPKPTGK
ncbi:MAG: LVIVD repeat-containing protein [Oceanococcus sp.]